MSTETGPFWADLGAAGIAGIDVAQVQPKGNSQAWHSTKRSFQLGGKTTGVSIDLKRLLNG
jgi:hypothetical protein